MLHARAVKLGAIAIAAFVLSCSSLQSSVTRSAIPCSQVSTVNADYSRTASRFLIREVRVPTRANLDLAAYAENIMLYDSAEHGSIDQTSTTGGLAQLHFKNALDSATLSDSLSGTPLLPNEICTPMAWAGLREYLIKWDLGKARSLIESCNRVAEENWENDKVSRPMQELSRLYLHAGPNGWELWGKIEVKPWAKALFPVLHDEEGDGFCDFYGRLNTTNTDQDVFKRIVSDYRTTLLDYEGVVTWGHDLASFWRPNYNTDMISNDPLKWEGSDGDRVMAGQIQKWISGRPAVVIRGTPFGITLYNVFMVDGIGPETDSSTAVASEPLSGDFDKGPTGKAIETEGKKPLQNERNPNWPRDPHK